ncbi:MAG: ribonuclease III domain-containing protein [Eubacteriales bacterium]|nr:ribonuclease III domain-containing protein [Eubacteriales bacterium]
MGRVEDKIDRLAGSLEMAFLGDTIYDFYIRRRLLVAGGPMKQLQQAASKRVCAKAQSRALGLVEEMLSEEERDVVRRARNTKQRPPKNADPAQYQRATGLEALLGWLYIQEKHDRIDQLMCEILAHMNEIISTDEGEKHHA